MKIKDTDKQTKVGLLQSRCRVVFTFLAVTIKNT